MDYKQKYLMITEQYCREVDKRDALLELILQDQSNDDGSSNISEFVIRQINEILDKSTT